MDRSGRAFIWAGTGAVLLTVVVLGVFAAARGLPWWLPLNATSHAVYGLDAVKGNSLDWPHTGLGALIHVVSCFFWALVGLVLLVLLRRVGSSRAAAPWIAGLGTAVLAGIVDYWLMPARLTPGWELVLGWQGVIAGLLALGIGLAPGLSVARRPATPQSSPRPAPQPKRVPPAQDVSDPAFRKLRHREGGVFDQRMQRIDPAGKHTADRNASEPRQSSPPRSKK